MSDIMADFNKRLMERMSEMRMSQADLCRSTGLATSMVSHYCTGQRTPSVQVAGKIARALDTSIDALVFGKPDVTKKHAGTSADGPAVKKYTGSPAGEPDISEAKRAYLLRKKAGTQICDDYELLTMFRSLNAEGQTKVLAYIDDLQLTRKYRSRK